MPVQLERATIGKLTHESAEIRLRTLEQIDNKLRRAVIHNEELHFKPGELCKQLIRWFGQQPLQIPERALELLLLVLRSRYGPTAIQQLGAERFQREMSKVQKLLHGHPAELRLTEQIQRVISNYQQQLNEELDDVSETMEMCTLSNRAESTDSEKDKMIIQCPPVDYEPPWTKPVIADFNAMKMLSDVFKSTSATHDELQNALQHLQVTMVDYPAEYMLQPPHIFLNLLHLYDTVALEKQCTFEDVANTLLIFVRVLQKRLRMHYNVLSYATNTKDPPTQAKTQLLISKTLQLLVDKSIKQLETHLHDYRKDTKLVLELLLATLQIYKMQHFNFDHEMLMKLHNLCEKLNESCTHKEHFTLQRVKYLVCVFAQQDMVTYNVERRYRIQELELLEPLLRDFSFKLNFPNRYACLQKLMACDVKNFKEKLERLQHYESAFHMAVELLKNPQYLDSKTVLEHGVDICTTLDKLQSCKLADQLFCAIVKCNPYYDAHIKMKENANELLLNLLRLRHVSLKAHIYQKLAMAVRKHFACLMNGESYCGGIEQSKLSSAHIIGVPWSTTLVMQLIYESFESQNLQIKEHCEDVLVLLLRTQHLIAGDWHKMLEIVTPVLPLLQCCTHLPKVMQHIDHKLYDPDAQNLPDLPMLQGNVCFLFQRERELRSEAMTRLIYILSQRLPNADDYVPNIMEISDIIPNDLCFLTTPREYTRIFSTTEAFSELSTMHNLISLLETPDIQPLIRKTTLMQLNVLCQQWEMLSAFCNESAHYIVLQALENAMQCSTYADYVDAAIPAISLLSKLLLYDAKLRHELSDTLNIYVLLLRALFMYQNNMQLRQDASICLFLLAFASFVVVVGSERIEAPKLLGNLQLPLRCELHSFTQSNYELDELNSIFSNKNEELLYLRQLLANSFCETHAKVNMEYFSKEQKYDFAMELRLTQHDWRLMKATSPTENIRRFLRAISNATEHASLINGIISLQFQLLVNDYELKMNTQMAQELYQLISKYLQLPPGNADDLQLYAHLVDLCELCVRLPVPAMIECLCNTLVNDFQHAFITLLRSVELPLDLYYKLCLLLRHLLAASENCTTLTAKLNIFCCNLYELLAELVTQLFEQRELQRVRCLLRLLEFLSATDLGMNDKELHAHCKRFLNLSCTLKSHTQTGAQWQRDCLSLVCRLFLQMKQPQQTFKFKSATIRYLSGLCGHNDQQVRALAWCVLSYVAQYRDNETTGLEIINTELGYLPGGFMACCLCTLLDTEEVLLVRTLAGNLFATFLSDADKYEEAFQLLEQHGFFTLVNEALRECCVFEPQLALHFNHREAGIVSDCDLISSYTRICISMLRANTCFLQVLCGQAFMSQLYELVKMNIQTDNIAFHKMCANICQLYGLSYAENFEFLQRTLCRDRLFMSNLYNLLKLANAEQTVLVNVLQLLSALCKDDVGFDNFCQSFFLMPEYLLKVLLRGINVAHINSPLQRCCLGLLSLLLIKSQKQQKDLVGHQRTFLEALERQIEIVHPSVKSPTEDTISKLQQAPSYLLKSNVPNDSESINSMPEQGDAIKNSFAVIVFIELLRVFTHLYQPQACKFEHGPTAAQIQVTETLAMLLKFSPEAQSAAKDLKLFDKLLRIFRIFFEEFKSSATTYVRRYGEAKKSTIVKNFQLILNIHLNWFSAPGTCLTDELQAHELSKILMQLWPWLAHSSDLKLLVLQVCSYHSEHSFIVCQHFATLISNYANSVLQLIIKIVTTETSKIKASSTDCFPVISTGLRVIMNCCACVEGRVTLVKAHILDMFDGLHPFNLKSHKTKSEILNAWLQFWDLFSRYPEGAQARNLNTLCDVINRATPRSKTRIFCLKILRNMCFQTSNRTTLIASAHFICTVDAIIAQPMDTTLNISYEEQLYVCVAIWKLISGGVKFVAMVRGTRLAKRLSMLREHLAAIEEEHMQCLRDLAFAADLKHVLDIILVIFTN